MGNYFSQLRNKILVVEEKFHFRREEISSLKVLRHKKLTNVHGHFHTSSGFSPAGGARSPG